VTHRFVISRCIEIDAGHRVPDHTSKCYNLHGHRYKIELGVDSETLQSTGPETGMVKDFGFLKDLMMKTIHDRFDHSLMLYVEDPILEVFLVHTRIKSLKEEFQLGQFHQSQSPFIPCKAKRFPVPVSLVVCAFVPTAENLARAWYEALQPGIREALGNDPSYVKVWETPNSIAEYFPSVKVRPM